MKMTNFYRCLATALFVAVACVSVCAATALAPYGQFESEAWSAKYYYALIGEGEPASNWYAADFDDTAWSTIEGPISLTEQWSSYPSLSFIGTPWQANNSSYWLRRHFTVGSLNNDCYMLFVIHDDACTVYLNGVQIYNNSSALTAPGYNTVLLSGAALAALKEGDNVLAVYVSDSGGGQALIDFGLYGYDFTGVVTSTDVPVTFQNDAIHPWGVEGTEAVIRGNNQSNYYAASWLTMSFSSAKRTELTFDWARYDYSYHQALEVYIDGVYQGYTTNSSYTNQRFFLDAGDHVVAFRDSVAYRNYTQNWAAIKNIRVRELQPLETAVLTANSQPLTFQNESALPWTIEDGYVEHNTRGESYKGGTFSTSFSVDKTSKLTFYFKVANTANDWANYEDRHNFFVRVNGVQITKAWNNQSDTYWSMALEPGDYQVEWTDTVYSSYNGYWYYTQVRDIELSNNWIDVDLASVGTLGYEVLYSGKANELRDVEFLKVSGPLNASDWTDIKNMTNLVALDLSEAQITELPNQVFDGKSLLSSVILPEGLVTIGEYAFRGTGIRRMHVPSTVTTIGQRAFESTPLAYLTFAAGSQMNTIGVYAFNNCTSLQSVDFGDNSQLRTIGERAFSSCTAMKSVNFGENSVLVSIGRGAFAWCYALTDVVLSNTVTDVSYGAFQSCTALKSIVFSDAMTVINDHVCYGCSSLEQVHLPSALKSINTRSFQNTGSLKEIDIPATVNEIRSQAFDNSGLESLVLPITMQYLYRYAFSNCRSLKYVELPSYLERGASLDYYTYFYSADGSDYYRDNYRHYGYRYNFQNCTALETVVMRAATPPTIDEDPFSGARAKGDMALVVPSFAVVSYKLDTYWYQFGNIVEGDDVDYWKITSPLMLTNNRRMQGKPDVDLYYGGQLTVGGNAPMTMGQFNMYVNESNPGRLLNTCDAMAADNVQTHFAVDANKWFFFTPMHDVNVSDIQVSNDASYVFRYYDAQNRATNGASGSWKNVDSDKLLAGQGYIFHCNKACTITFPADAAGQAQLFQTGDVSRTLTVNEATTTANRSWNYVGNPYPAYFDIYYMDFTAPITVWTGSTYKAYSVADDDFVLRPMQSFFVQKPDAVEQITFHKEGRQLTTDIAAHTGNRAAVSSQRNIFNLAIGTVNGQSSMLNGQSLDETRVVINDEASMGYEVERDAAKFMSMDASVPQLYTVDNEGNQYAINERPMDSGLVRLAYYAGTDGFYTISCLRADGSVMLYDAELNTTVDITSEPYTFQSNATGGVNSSRFALTFSRNGEATGLGDKLSAEGDGLAAAPAYNVAGQRVDSSARGLLIQNGKKTVRK